MKISENESLVSVLDDKGELIAVSRKNGHILTYLCKEVNMTEYTKLLTSIAAKEPQN